MLTHTEMGFPMDTRSPSHLRRLVTLAVFVAAVGVSGSAQASITLALNPPIRANKGRTPTNPDIKVGNTGINHDDCLNNEEWTFAFTSLVTAIPGGSFGALDIWGTPGTSAP